METKKCNYCKTDIPKDATICSSCKKDVRNWFIKHWIIITFLVLSLLWSIMQWFEDAQNQSNWNNIEQTSNNNVQIDTWESAKSVDEILNSKYNHFFDSNGLNIKLYIRLKEENLWQNMNVLRAQFFTSDNKKQIILNTIFTVDLKEYASNSRYNVETNEVEEFYYSEVK